MLDVYSLIRSAEIREYYRQNDALDIFAKEQLILHSFISVQQKAAWLKRLSETGTREENSRIEEMYRVYSRYIDSIYHPSVRTVFLPQALWWHLDRTFIHTSTEGLVGAYDTIEEMMAEMERMYAGYEGEVSAKAATLQVPQDEKVKFQVVFTMFLIDGKWEIKDFCVGDEELKQQGVSEDTIYRFSESGLNHPLPFENGSKLKLQFPFMEKPVYGTLESELDGNGCWYHFLDCEGDKECDSSFDLTRAEINFMVYGYNSLDWIERA